MGFGRALLSCGLLLAVPAIYIPDRSRFGLLYRTTITMEELEHLLQAQDDAYPHLAVLSKTRNSLLRNLAVDPFERFLRLDTIESKRLKKNKKGLNGDHRY